jgi:hypothetical protein
MATLMGVIEAHTRSSSRSDTNGRGMIDYLIRATCRVLDDLANERGVDAHELVRSQLSATNTTSDEYHLVAQTLLATAFLPTARASLYDQTLDVAAPAYRRLGTAILDLWFDAAFDRRARVWPPVEPPRSCCPGVCPRSRNAWLRLLRRHILQRCSDAHEIEKLCAADNKTVQVDGVALDRGSPSAPPRWPIGHRSPIVYR